jgi:hypothetical protein
MFHCASPQISAKSCFPKGPKAASLHQKWLPKAILQSGSRKLRLKVATRCLLSKLIAPKLQPFNTKRAFKEAPESPKVAIENCSLNSYCEN